MPCDDAEVTGNLDANHKLSNGVSATVTTPDVAENLK